MLSEKNMRDRLGRFTASGFSRLMKESRGSGPNRTFESYVWEKIEETVRGRVEPGYVSKEMQWGNEWEGRAIEFYCHRYGVGGEPSEFIPYGLHAGGTPDWITDEGIPVQFKCPYTVRSHYEFLDIPILDPSTHDAYFYQTQLEMVITETEMMEFVSFMPLLPPSKRLIRMVLYRDDHAVSRMLGKLEQAIEMKLKILRDLGWQVPDDYVKTHQNEEE